MPVVEHLVPGDHVLAEIGEVDARLACVHAERGGLGQGSDAPAARDPEPTNLGQIQLANFVNPEGLTSIGGNIYIESAATGPPIVGVPGEGSVGTLIQGHLEASNVDPVKELIQLIKKQRAFEMNSQSIQAADEVLQVIGNLRRF